MTAKVFLRRFTEVPMTPSGKRIHPTDTGRLTLR
jgi:hypothetical protein